MQFRLSSDSVMRWNVIHLQLAGLWPVENSRLFSLYTAWLFFTQCHIVVLESIDLCTYTGDFSRAVLNICAMATFFANVCKMFHFQFRKGDYFRLVTELDAFVSEQRTKYSHNETVKELLDTSTKRTSSITKAVMVYLIVWTFMVVPALFLIEAPYGVFPLMAWYPFTADIWPRYEIIITLHFLTIGYCFFTSWGMDLFFGCLMYHLSLQLRLLNYHLANIRCRSKADRILEKSLPEIEALSTSHVERETTKTAQQKQFEGEVYERSAEDVMYDDLLQCIKHHQRIIRYAESVENVANPVILSQFVVSVLVLCVVLFQTSSELETLTAFVRFLVYLLELLLQIFIYCWVAHQIFEESEHVGEAAYNSDWPDGSASYKAALRLVMRRSQRPITISAGTIYAIDRTTFVSIVNASYSYYAVLRQINN
uniref:Odorant receptor n=1 Tax=Ceracris kiangsu TaxID=227354 RepID=A0A6M6DLV7_CERKI|nr:odorant receptor 23 [Ceracris kiangsu]